MSETGQVNTMIHPEDLPKEVYYWVRQAGFFASKARELLADESMKGEHEVYEIEIEDPKLKMKTTQFFTVDLDSPRQRVVLEEMADNVERLRLDRKGVYDLPELMLEKILKCGTVAIYDAYQQAQEMLESAENISPDFSEEKEFFTREIEKTDDQGRKTYLKEPFKIDFSNSGEKIYLHNQVEILKRMTRFPSEWVKLPEHMDRLAEAK